MRTRIARQLIGLGLILCLPKAVFAFELTMDNDATLDGTPSAPFKIFVAGESAASTLTSPCDGEIVATQVYWASTLGTAAPQVEQSITLHGEGAHPSPGPILTNQSGGDAQISGPTLVDGVMNEFRYLDPPTNSIALGVPVSAGEPFVASLTFANASSGGGSATPSVTIDQNGCRPGLNAVDVNPAGWVDACMLGASGDFVIRAVIECSSAPPVPVTGEWGSFLLGVALTLVGIAGIAIGRILKEDDL